MSPTLPKVDKALFDTNTVIAATILQHPHHAAALAWFQRVRRKEIEGFLSSHSLAEIFSILTTEKGPFKLSAQDALSHIKKGILPYVQVVSVDANDYLSLLEHLASMGIKGAKVYDGLIAFVAWKANVDYLVTINKTHFDAIFPAYKDKIINPVANVNTTP